MKLSFDVAKRQQSASLADDVDDIFDKPSTLQAKRRVKQWTYELIKQYRAIGDIKNDIFVRVEQVQSGTANPRTRTLTLPYWLLSRPWEFQQAFAIHEIAHFVMFDNYRQAQGHGPRFIRTEKHMCQLILKLRPLYQRTRGYGLGYIACHDHPDYTTNEFVFDWNGAAPDSSSFLL